MGGRKLVGGGEGGGGGDENTSRDITGAAHKGVDR